MYKTGKDSVGHDYESFGNGNAKGIWKLLPDVSLLTKPEEQEKGRTLGITWPPGGIWVTLVSHFPCHWARSLTVQGGKCPIPASVPLPKLFQFPEILIPTLYSSFRLLHLLKWPRFSLPVPEGCPWPTRAPRSSCRKPYRTYSHSLLVPRRWLWGVMEISYRGAPSSKSKTWSVCTQNWSLLWLLKTT